jgi:hypothetical protein
MSGEADALVGMGLREGKQLQTLRINLLSVLTRGVIQENDAVRSSFDLYGAKADGSYGGYNDRDSDRYGDRDTDCGMDRNSGMGVYPFMASPPANSSKQWIGSSQIGMKPAIKATSSVVLTREQIQTYELLTMSTVI